jgi:hypothetical protein
MKLTEIGPEDADILDRLKLRSKGGSFLPSTLILLVHYSFGLMLARVFQLLCVVCTLL